MITAKGVDWQKYFIKWANGNQDAAAFLEMIFEAARLADDIVDRPEADRSSLVSALMLKCLVGIASNRFFQANSGMLFAPINEAISAWHLSNEFQKSDDTRLQNFGFVYREGPSRIAVAVALITGGTEHSLAVFREVSSDLITSETIDVWLKEVK